MPTVLQFRRGTTAQNDAFTGSAGELTFNSTNGSLHVHDGTTQGGHETLRADMSNATGDADQHIEDVVADVTIDGGTY
jgi:hypothetical protein